MKLNWKIIVILLIALTLRVWKLGSIPAGLTPDEASLGYNAYSILKTGRDEYGKFLPIIFKSFGDYKPGLYVYLAVPFVANLGLNEFAVRLPSALAGVASVWLLYLLVRELFKNEKLAIVSGLVMALNPWSIYFSRGAWEVNVALTLTLAGIYFFFKSRVESKYFILSCLFFALTLLTYQGAKLATGIVILILLVLYWRDIIKFKAQHLALGLGVATIISLPIIFSFFIGQTARLNVFSVFSYPRPKDYLQTFLNEGGEKVNSLTYYLFHSEALNFARGVLGRYFNHFSTRFLFFEGDWQNPRHTPPYQGVLVLGDLVLLVFGFAALVKMGAKKEVLFVWLWLALAPLPSILSRDQVHAARALNMSIPLIILISLGLTKVSKKFLPLVGLIYLGSYVYFLDAYFIHVPAHGSEYWQYGYKQMVEVITPIQKNYKAVYIEQSFAQPYIYFLFFQKYDPASYQKQAKLASGQNGDVGMVEKIDNIYFTNIDWSVNSRQSGTLVVANPEKITKDNYKDEKLYRLVKEIDYLDKKVAYSIVEVK